MSLTIDFTDQLTVVTCWCGMNHAVPTTLRDYQLRCHADGRNIPSIYCPAGHTHSPAGESKVAKLQQELERTKNRAARAAAERDQAEASRRAQKAATTRLKNRIGAGTCPCCKRTFQQLARHMKSQHPEYRNA